MIDLINTSHFTGGNMRPADIRLEKMRHSVGEMFSVTVMFVVVFVISKVPKTPAWARPNMLYPIPKVLMRVPGMANTRIDMKLSRKASSYRAMAESRMIGGRRNWKKSLLRLINHC